MDKNHLFCFYHSFPLALSHPVRFSTFCPTSPPEPRLELDERGAQNGKLGIITAQQSREFKCLAEISLEERKRALTPSLSF